jgi:NADH:ubiquinone oxidoreductase subunit E
MKPMQQEPSRTGRERENLLGKLKEVQNEFRHVPKEFMAETARSSD